MIIPVFPGSDNTESLLVSLDGSPFTFSGVTKVEVSACDPLKRCVGCDEPVISSETDAVNYTSGSNQLDVRFGWLNLQQGRYNCKVTVYSPNSPKGVVIVGDGLDSKIQLSVKC